MGLLILWIGVAGIACINPIIGGIVALVLTFMGVEHK